MAKKRCFFDIILLVLIFVVVVFSYVLIKPYYKTYVDGVFAHAYSFVLLFILFFIGFLFKRKGRLNLETLILLIFLAGVVLKINYSLMTPVSYRQHDLSDATGNGHMGYAVTIYLTGSLPKATDSHGYLQYQFYHPPFNAFIQAQWMKVSKVILDSYNSFKGTEIYNTNNVTVLFETTQILSTYYMVLTSYIGIKFIKNLSVNKISTIFGVCFMSLFSTLILFAAQENNDPLCLLFSFAALYFTLKWWKEKKLLYSIFIGLFVGLAAFAKFSGFLSGAPAALIYVIEFVKQLASKNKEDRKHLIFHPILICLIAFPLGMWWPIYTYKTYGQPIGFVFGDLTQLLYKGDYSFFERFICFWNFNEMTTSLWGNTFKLYNIPNFVIKSSLFGEYSFMHVEAFAVAAIGINYLFVILSILLSALYFFTSLNENSKEKWFSIFLIFTQIASFVYFNIKMPYGCTMDFRYIVPTLIGFLIFDSLAINKFFSKKSVGGFLSAIVAFLGFALITTTTIFYLFAI